MRTYLKEIILGIGVALLLAFAVIAFITVTQREQAALSTSLPALVPSGPTALIRINRPDLFQRMIISEPAVQNAFAEQLPPIFIGLLRELRMQSAQISLHPQGHILYMHTGRETSAAEKYIRQEIFSPYQPQEHIRGDLRFYFFPTETSSFFGYYVHNDVLVSSHSRKLLEAAGARHTASADVSLPAGISRQLSILDNNAPANIIFNGENTTFPPSALPADFWIGADLFAGEGTICCHIRLQTTSPAEADSIATFLQDRLPEASLTLQLSAPGAQPAITACLPKGK